MYKRVVVDDIFINFCLYPSQMDAPTRLYMETHVPYAFLSIGIHSPHMSSFEYALEHCATYKNKIRHSITETPLPDCTYRNCSRDVRNNPWKIFYDRNKPTM